MRSFGRTIGCLFLVALAVPEPPRRTTGSPSRSRRSPSGTASICSSAAAGNIGLSVGSDGTFLIDDQYAPLTEKIVAAIRKVTADPVRFLVNTHWHGDHTGGNENFGKRGKRRRRAPRTFASG